jgi:hypothetical protein
MVLAENKLAIKVMKILMRSEEAGAQSLSGVSQQSQKIWKTRRPAPYVM